MAKTFTVQDFNERFPDDDACLDHLFRVRFANDATCPKCSKGKVYRLAKEPAYSCSHCGHHVHPMVGTPFEKSHTSLHKWFYAMYLFAMSRHGVPAKELQRQLGVTYKTAWRMGHEIRKYMAKVDGDDPLSGHVEIDETWIGGKRKGKHGKSAMKYKTVVLGMLRRGGDLITRVVPNDHKVTLIPHVWQHVTTGATVSTDEHPSYNRLFKLGYQHGRVNHARDQWVSGIHHTNSLENFWSQLKRSIRGTHVHVSRKHMAKYLGEFEFRYNMRKKQEFIFGRLLLSL
jgi:transposase-like protein